MVVQRHIGLPRGIGRNGPEQPFGQGQQPFLESGRVMAGLRAERIPAVAEGGLHLAQPVAHRVPVHVPDRQGRLGRKRGGRMPCRGRAASERHRRHDGPQRRPAPGRRDRPARQAFGRGDDPRKGVEPTPVKRIGPGQDGYPG